jgi:hypothetical protein
MSRGTAVYGHPIGRFAIHALQSAGKGLIEMVRQTRYSAAVAPPSSLAPAQVVRVAGPAPFPDVDSGVHISARQGGQS